MRPTDVGASAALLFVAAGAGLAAAAVAVAWAVSGRPAVLLLAIPPAALSALALYRLRQTGGRP